jgi:hypothetical protein
VLWFNCVLVQVFDLLFVVVARFDFALVVEDFALVVALGFGFVAVFGFALGFGFVAVFGFALGFGLGFGFAVAFGVALGLGCTFNEGATCLVGSWIVPLTLPPAVLIFSAAR